jgi:nifR3 family TIM-barrel protein
MGCPVRKVIKKGYGAALMRDPLRAQAIIQAICAQTSLPVTVKFRSGWTDERIIAPEFAAMAEEAGAAAVVVHGRTWAQGFSGKADWQVIRAVKKAVSIPVIGNGDVLTHADALAMMKATGCDGVMVGRGALSNPWLFGPDDRPVSLAGRMELIGRYLHLAQQFLPLPKVLFKVKNQIAKLLTGLNGAAHMRQALYACDSIEAIMAILRDQHADDLPAESSMKAALQ